MKLHSNDRARTVAGVLGICLVALAGSAAQPATAWEVGIPRETAVPRDGFSYLEDRDGVEALSWVATQNRRTIGELEGDSEFRNYFQSALASEATSLSADEPMLMPRSKALWMRRGWVYQLWVDTSHQRGVWRRSMLHTFMARRPKWETLLDLDALSISEKTDWMFVQAYFSPNSKRCLLQLSEGASAKMAWREFDLEERVFAKDGFSLPAARFTTMAWRSDDSVIVAGDWGDDSVTRAALPLLVKQWSRGQPISLARELLRGDDSDNLVYVRIGDAMDGGIAENAEGIRVVHVARNDKSNKLHWWRVAAGGQLEELRALPPSRVEPVLYKDQYIILLQEDWSNGPTLWKRGSVLAIPASEVVKTNPRVYPIISPEQDMSVSLVAAKTSSGLLLQGSWLGYGKLWRARFEHGAWRTDVVPLPEHGVALAEASDTNSTVALLRYEGFLSPPSLYALDVETNNLALLTRGKDQFDSTPFTVERMEAKSADGTRVPYSLIRRRSALFDGNSPALVVGYGAGGATYFPSYSGVLGKLWLEKGGIYVVANVRGGQERGRAWHVRGLGRQKTYDDMVAVAQDLLFRKISSPKRLGFMGHSAGGLLGAVMLTKHPDLFGAVVLKAPFVDQLRYDLLGGGAGLRSEEYGSYDVEAERVFLERTSPFQNLRAGKDQPRPFVITSITDTTVLPAQPRRFAAKMEELKMPFLFFETSSGGHGLAVTPADRAKLEAYIFIYLKRELLDPAS